MIRLIGAETHRWVARRGLWVASDGPHINQELHEDIALLPE